jgi:serine/threonine protein phosphatase PrpC
LRGNSLEQLSVDHTVIQELLHQGAITEAEVANHPQRSVLTQVLMGEREQEAVIQVVDVKAKDRFLLCSDGLSSVLSEKEIKSLIKGKDRAAAIDALIDATYINGAPDNVTVVIADITESSNNEKIEAIGAAQ